jgi:hypothetical protein
MRDMNKRSWTWAIASTLAVGTAGAIYAHEGHGVPPAAPTARFATHRPVPIHFDLFRGNRIFMPTAINGKPASAMLDSGAGMIALDRDFADSLGLTGGQSISVGSAGGPIPGSMVSGVTIRLGGLTLSGTTVLVIDLAPIARRIGRPINVILGRELFDAGVVDLDFAKHTLTVLPESDYKPPRGAERIPMTRSEGGIREIPIRIEGHDPVQAQLDLGNAGSMVLSRDYWESQKLLDGRRSIGGQSAGVGGTAAKRVASLTSVRLGSFEFKNVPAGFNQNAKDLPAKGANIGFDMLSRFRLAIDNARDALYLIRGRGPFPPLPRDRAGLRTVIAGDRLKVVFVSPGSPADTAGFKAGEEIVAVNGKRVDAGYYASAAHDWEKWAAGRRVLLRCADGREIPIVLADYY